MIHTILRRRYIRKWLGIVRPKAREIRRLKAEIEASEYRTKQMQFAVIGGVVLSWARVEHNIDAWVEVIHLTGGDKRIQAHLPASLDRELDYIKVAWKTERVTRSLKAEGAKLLAEIHRLKIFRHNLVHGIINLNDPEAITFHLWKVKGAKRVELKTPYSDKALIENVTALVELNRALEAFVLDFARFKADLMKGNG